MSYENGSSNARMTSKIGNCPERLIGRKSVPGPRGFNVLIFSTTYRVVGFACVPERVTAAPTQRFAAMVHWFD